MIIRAAEAGDAEAVAQLIYEAIDDIAFQLTGEETEERATKGLRELFLQPGNRFSSGQVLVAVHEGAVAGMILCYYGSEAEALDAPIKERLRIVRGDAQPIIDKEADEDEYYIDSIAVFPAYRGLGIAKALLHAAEEAGITLGYQRIALNVEYENERAHRLYRSLGYVQDKDVSINGHAYRHMAKPLTSVKHA
ncbi:GCN5-related N-acetyltransferase [Paenibacillus curdlanolyticus YK9]|uniref:GCN5-related N-acetyltransferase n=1 Tax=Paenibacillus curdlanolyticus YK9 TaxID=717606 RepID=E0IGH7_9BACL|nr:GNAT family N-acetyltransferase [Paenibacillus curdlanolyticus]EFM08417.1 GCN5-related N-acetyltransferase [Paenibacillus curdlanolyticus YK9]